MRARQAASRPKERHHERTFLHRAFPALSGDAGSHDHRGTRPGGRRAVVPHHEHETGRQIGLLLRGDRRGTVQAPGGSGRPAPAGGYRGAQRQGSMEIRGPGARRRCARRRSEDPVHAAPDMIHPTAIVHSGAKLAPGVSVGPYSLIGEHVEIGEGTSIGPHVVIEGRTRIGANNRIFGFSSLGGPPQDKKYGGEATALEIGERNTIREYCSFNCGTAQDAGVTRIGSDNWIMAYVHIAHDCQVGNHTVFANVATLGGHVRVGDYAILGGFTGAHQFVSIGAHSITGVATVLLQDLPPYVMAAGNTAKPFGINSEGLKRRGFGAEKIAAIKKAYKTLYRSGLVFKEARRKIAAQAKACPELHVLVDFLDVSRRGIIR